MRVVSMSGHWPWVGSWAGLEQGSRHPLGGYYQQLVTHDSSIGNSDKHNILKYYTAVCTRSKTDLNCYKYKMVLDC